MRINRWLYQGVDDTMHSEQYGHRPGRVQQAIDEVQGHLRKAKNKDEYRAACAIGQPPADGRGNDIGYCPCRVCQANQRNRCTKVVMQPDWRKSEIETKIEVVTEGKYVRPNQGKREKCAIGYSLCTLPCFYADFPFNAYHDDDK